MIEQLRSVRRADGTVEVVRVINRALLQQWTRDDSKAFEQSVVWLEDIDNLDFVRVATIRNAKSRRGRLRVGGDDGGVRTIGYTKLTEDAPIDPQTGGYTRRVFFLKESDEGLNMNAAPAGAVDPTTIYPGRPGLPPQTEDDGYPYYLRRA